MSTRFPGKQVPGFSSPAANFDEPLQMLAACHERIERHCAMLQRLVPHLALHGADEQARSAAAQLLRYFDTAARHHHADEEIDLFPALIESMAGSDAVCLRELTTGLRNEHHELDAGWQRLRPALERIAAGEAARLVAGEVDALVELYARHLARENEEVLPMAQRLLSDDDLLRIGRAMQARRGIAP